MWVVRVHLLCFVHRQLLTANVLFIICSAARTGQLCSFLEGSWSWKLRDTIVSVKKITYIMSLQNWASGKQFTSSRFNFNLSLSLCIRHWFNLSPPVIATLLIYLPYYSFFPTMPLAFLYLLRSITRRRHFISDLLSYVYICMQDIVIDFECSTTYNLIFLVIL